MIARSRVRCFRRPIAAVVTLGAVCGSMLVIAHPAGAASTLAAIAGAVTCATTGTTACQTYTNSGTPYRVFVTPEGDTRGLFIASNSPRGFVVRETQGGRSTFAFDYRISAHRSVTAETHGAPVAARLRAPSNAAARKSACSPTGHTYESTSAHLHRREI